MKDGAQIKILNIIRFQAVIETRLALCFNKQVMTRSRIKLAVHGLFSKGSALVIWKQLILNHSNFRKYIH